MLDAEKSSALFDFIQEDAEQAVVLSDERIPQIRELERFHLQVEKLSHDAMRLSVDSDVACKTALDLCAQSRELQHKIDLQRKSLIEPSRKLIAMVNDFAKGFDQRLDQAISMTTLKAVAWDKKKKEQQEEAKKQAQELAATLGLDIEEITIAEPQSVTSANATFQTRTTFDFEVSDMSIVPLEYLTIDESKVKKAIKMGTRDIPGLVIKEVLTTGIRRK